MTDMTKGRMTLDEDGNLVWTPFEKPKADPNLWQLTRAISSPFLLKPHNPKRRLKMPERKSA